MIPIEEMRVLLQQSLKPKRYEHSVRVYETALKMESISMQMLRK